MTLAHGRSYLAIPGPSAMPDRVLRAMHRAAPNIYAGELHDMTASLFPDLRRVARTEHSVAIYIGNGHAAWEAALANVAGPGDAVLVLVTGRFGVGWGQMAEAMGIEVRTLSFGKKAPVDPGRVEEALRADAEGRIKAVLFVHVDTSTSVRSDCAAVRAAMDASGHPAILMADCIASLGCDVFEMDAWGADVTVTGCQKGLMTPPGLAFVFFGPRAAARRAEMERVSLYWDWGPRADPEIYYQHFCGTAPTHHLYGLREALDMIAEEGIKAVWARHERLARAIWAAVEAWGEGGDLELNVPERAHRSHAVTSLSAGGEDGERLRAWLEARAGVLLGIGLGMDATDRPAGGSFFRIGHMGHVNAHMVMGVLGTMQAGMEALGMAYGLGGLDAAAAVISEA